MKLKILTLYRVRCACYMVMLVGVLGRYLTDTFRIQTPS